MDERRHLRRAAVERKNSATGLAGDLSSKSPKKPVRAGNRRESANERVLREVACDLLAWQLRSGWPSNFGPMIE